MASRRRLLSIATITVALSAVTERIASLRSDDDVHIDALAPMFDARRELMQLQQRAEETEREDTPVTKAKKSAAKASRSRAATPTPMFGGGET